LSTAKLSERIASLLSDPASQRHTRSLGFSPIPSDLVANSIDDPIGMVAAKMAIDDPVFEQESLVILQE